MSVWKKYIKKGTAEMRKLTLAETKAQISPWISISEEDLENGSPKSGDMIARNPENHKDQWLVSKEFFEANYEPDNQ